ncbi:MAG TPA: RNA polymerase subunit sigma-24 [Verrucomicrobiales bacterium]|nr:RNA polymerase subunit sigma-24 [Verrucomicrobiales bacterium]
MRLAVARAVAITLPIAMPQKTASAVASTHPPESKGDFPKTRWSVVLAAQCGGASSGRALEDLCRAYWYPIYVYLRRTGSGPHDAEDLTQGFFLEFLARDSLSRVTPERGRMRSFLLTSLKHYVTNEWRKETAQKRGGGATIVSIDQMSAEERFANEPRHDDSPDILFDQSWAYAVLDSTMARLRKYYEGFGKAALFAEIESCLSWGEKDGSYAEKAARLGLTEAAVRFAVHQMRKRYQSILRGQITDTVATQEDAEAEIAHLCAVLSAG